MEFVVFQIRFGVLEHLAQHILLVDRIRWKSKCRRLLVCF